MLEEFDTTTLNVKEYGLLMGIRFETTECLFWKALTKITEEANTLACNDGNETNRDMQWGPNQRKSARKRSRTASIDDKPLGKQLGKGNRNIFNTVDTEPKVIKQTYYFGSHCKKKKTISSTIIEVQDSSANTMNEQAEIKNDQISHEADQAYHYKLKKETEKAVTGKIKPGINLQGYCTNTGCLASDEKLLVWVNLGFSNISFSSANTSYPCPDCGKSTVTFIRKTTIFNSEHKISANDNTPEKTNHYKCSYLIKSRLSYKVNASEIRQHATSLEDLIARSEKAMESNEIKKLSSKLQQYDIIVVKPLEVKDKVRLLEKIKNDYNGDYKQVFDIGRFTILCDSAAKLQTAVAVMKETKKFNLIVSEDKDFFERQSKTHHRFHNIKLFVPEHDVYVEMQATLKKFTTLEEYAVIENPKLSHLFYERVRAWKPNSPEEENLKQASDETLTKINDVICEWIDDKEIQKLANRYESHLGIGILKPPQLSLKMAQFVYEQLCEFTPETIKGKAIYVILYEYYKRYIIGDKYPASCVDVALLLQKSREQEMKEDTEISQVLETYIPLQANKYAHVDSEENKENDTFDCLQHIIEFLEEKEEKKSEQQEQQRSVMIIQGKSGSGKSVFCRHLEKTLWNNYNSDSKQPIPVYISFAKSYNTKNEKDIILQTLQGKNINKASMDAIRETVYFVFIMDGFDEIFDKYSQSGNVLNNDDIETTLIGVNHNNAMMYLRPFTQQQTHNYIETFATMKSNWTSIEEVLNTYSDLFKMIKEPLLLRLILTILPSLNQKYSAETKISKAQVYEVLNDQWIDICSQSIFFKLTELRAPPKIHEIKFELEKNLQDLAFDMFCRGTQVAIESNFEHENNEVWSMENKNRGDTVNEKVEIKTMNEMTGASILNKHGINIVKYALRRIGDNKYQFLHKSCQEYYAAQKIIFDIIRISNSADNEQFETYAKNLCINFKLLNEELGIIQFIAERIRDTQPIYMRLQSLLFQVIEVSKRNKNFSIAAANAVTVLNSANVNMCNKNWKNVSIPHAILNHAYLEGTDFSNANLDNASFAQTHLNKTNFTNASMNGIYFGEYAYFEGCPSHVLGVRLSPDGKKIVFIQIMKFKYTIAVEFSSDGRKIVSCSYDKTIQIWNASTGESLHVMHEHSDWVNAVQFSDDNSRIVSCSRDGTIKLWNVSSQSQSKVKEGLGNVTGVRFLLNSFDILSFSGNTIRIWNESLENSQNLEGHTDDILGVRLSSDGRNYCHIHVSQFEYGICSLENSFRFWKNFQMLIACGLLDYTIQIWDVSLGKQIQTLKGHTRNINGIEFFPNEAKIISCSADGTIRIWDIGLERKIQITQECLGIVRTVHFSPNGSKIVSGSQDKTVRLWDALSGSQIQVFKGHSDRILGVLFSPNGSKLVSYSHDKVMIIWDLETRDRLPVSQRLSNYIRVAQFSPNSSKLALCLGDENILIYDISSKQQIQLNGHTSPVLRIQFSPNGSKIASCSNDKTIRLWDVFSGKEICIFRGHSKLVKGIQFFSDGSKIASYSWDNSIRVWDVESTTELFSLKQPKMINEIKLSRDDTKIVSSSYDHTIRLWDLLSKKQLWEVNTGPNNVRGIQFSPDESKIISYLDDTTIRVWDRSSGQQIQLLKGHTGRISGMQLSPNGSTLVSCSEDKTIRLWGCDSGKIVDATETSVVKCIWKVGVQKITCRTTWWETLMFLFIDWFTNKFYLTIYITIGKKNN
ncbi:peptidase C14, caspase catalytic subunit p20 [Reticulomyxa filosa]|uniref:Peptidase C14, caspase catalytic subunit p20 n=1 Tax=Reticulomyxa filosa TaxID=46433 RepID=X6MJS9_RETFI|nr:peptidase C14, caspase catalytic subunit p20 [Reticulomyxa filosa]|eukprot:ETO13712.1 peptidase C14, caspase catalytic subunit p20 [Reticulomyxa filosa]